MSHPMILLLGPTACGKTRIASLLAKEIGGEIISADSRQVYRGMDIGTGKDLDDYIVDGVKINAHLIDVAQAGEEYSLFRYKIDFEEALKDITTRGKIPVVCGGSGMYIETALGLYNLHEAKEDPQFRREIENKTNEELIEELKALKSVHNTTDIIDRERLVRALEVARADSANALTDSPNAPAGSANAPAGSAKENKTNAYDAEPRTDLIYGLDVPREIIRQRVTDRLKKRLDNGLIEEVKRIHSEGVSFETLKYYGLEYKYISLYLENELSFNDMFRLLNTAIHQFAKRQMTWFRRMEKRGIPITWLPPDADIIIKTVLSDLSRP